jgi:nucleoid DNA-binding protein
MNKAGLVEEVVGKVGLTRKGTGNVIDAITSAIMDSLERDEKVTLSPQAGILVLAFCLVLPEWQSLA